MYIIHSDTKHPNKRQRKDTCDPAPSKKTQIAPCFNANDFVQVPENDDSSINWPSSATVTRTVLASYGHNSQPVAPSVKAASYNWTLLWQTMNKINNLLSITYSTLHYYRKSSLRLLILVDNDKCGMSRLCTDSQISR